MAVIGYVQRAEDPEAHARAKQTAPARAMQGSCKARRRRLPALSNDRTEGVPVAHTIRRLCLVTLTGLAVLAPVAGAVPRQLTHGRARPSLLRSPAFAPHRTGIDPLAIPAQRPWDWPIGSGSALVGSAPAGKSPSAVALNPATHTIYVADGYSYSGPNALGDTVSVI